MQLQLVTRLGLSHGPPPPTGEQLLLEGDWPVPANGRSSLNQRATAQLGWIDERVDQLHADLLRRLDAVSPAPLTARLEFLLALALRYYLVKLARLTVVVQEILQSCSVTEVCLHHAPGRDDDYADLARRLCRLHKTPFRLIDSRHPALANAMSARATAPSRPPLALKHVVRAPVTLIRAACAAAERIRAAATSGSQTKRPIILFGTPAHLGPLVEALQSNGDARLYWLAETVALRQYLRWRPRGVCFLFCNAPKGKSQSDWLSHVSAGADGFTHRLAFGGIDLGPSVRRWIERHRERLTPRLAHARAWLEEVFRRHQPNGLIVDEDVTPLKRLAVAVAREHGTVSAVVQHGAPYVAFGFAPLAADTLFAWGESSRRQFRRWGIPGDRILTTGSPKHDALCTTARATTAPLRGNKRPRQWLLFASLHHSDDRPDLVAFQFTAATNAEMVRMALRALRRFPGHELVIKLHPRTPDPGHFTTLVGEFPELAQRVRVVRRGHNGRLVRRAACVLSCASSAGIEAMLCGVPVIQLMPAGSLDLLHPQEWCFAGTARSEPELHACLQEVFNGSISSPPPEQLAKVFANLEMPAASRIAAAIRSGVAVDQSLPAVPVPRPAALLGPPPIVPAASGGKGLT